MPKILMKASMKPLSKESVKVPPPPPKPAVEVDPFTIEEASLIISKAQSPTLMLQSVLGKFTLEEEATEVQRSD